MAEYITQSVEPTGVTDEAPKAVASMKLFASWEVDKASPNCIPR